MHSGGIAMLLELPQVRDDVSDASEPPSELSGKFSLTFIDGESIFS